MKMSSSLPPIEILIVHQVGLSGCCVVLLGGGEGGGGRGRWGIFSLLLRTPKKADDDSVLCIISDRATSDSLGFRAILKAHK